MAVTLPSQTLPSSSVPHQFSCSLQLFIQSDSRFSSSLASPSFLRHRHSTRTGAKKTAAREGGASPRAAGGRCQSADRAVGTPGGTPAVRPAPDGRARQRPLRRRGSCPPPAGPAGRQLAPAWRRQLLRTGRVARWGSCCRTWGRGRGDRPARDGAGRDAGAGGADRTTPSAEPGARQTAATVFSTERRRPLCAHR